jgi:hypothetical protein
MITSNLISLTTYLQAKERIIRDMDWKAVHLTWLESARLRNMDIDEQPVLTILVPSAERIRDIKLDESYLTKNS